MEQDRFGFHYIAITYKILIDTLMARKNTVIALCFLSPNPLHVIKLWPVIVSYFLQHLSVIVIYITYIVKYYSGAWKTLMDGLFYYYVKP